MSFLHFLFERGKIDESMKKEIEMIFRELNGQLSYEEILKETGWFDDEELVSLKAEYKLETNDMDTSVNDVQSQDHKINLKTDTETKKNRDDEPLSLSSFSLSQSFVKLAEESFLREHMLVPIKKEGGTLHVATTKDIDYKLIDELRNIFEVVKVETYRVAKEEVRRYFDSIFQFRVKDEGMEENYLNEDDDYEEDDLSGSDSPIVRFVDDLLARAVSMDVSDIHIEPEITGPSRIRFRIDGELTEFSEIPRRTHPQVVSRIKIMSDLDISKRYEPQDGEIRFRYEGASVNLRVNILPTTNGEKVVIRILGQSEALIPLEDIGFTEKNLETVKKKIKKSQGLILVVGPTGSGKTTTMYSMLDKMNVVQKNLSTIEDPVELNLPGLNQVQVSQRISFAETLRALLRQDPDIIMVGEIRDKETADIAVRSSLTGHLVLSTLHTNTALSTVTRMMDMGVQPYLLSDALELVISQRLVRRLCDDCKIPDNETTKEMIKKDLGGYDIESLNLEGQLYKTSPHGCDKCNRRGYKGRVPVHEVLEIDDGLRTLMIKGDTEAIRKYGNRRLMVDDALVKLFDGLTSYEEAKKILYEF